MSDKNTEISSDIYKKIRRTIENILTILSQQDARIKQLELLLNISSSQPNKDYLTDKLEEKLELMLESNSIESILSYLEDVSSYIAWNSNRILRLEKKSLGGK